MSCCWRKKSQIIISAGNTRLYLVVCIEVRYELIFVIGWMERERERERQIDVAVSIHGLLHTFILTLSMRGTRSNDTPGDEHTHPPRSWFLNTIF